MKAPTGRHECDHISPRWGFVDFCSLTWGVAPGFHMSPRWGTNSAIHTDESRSRLCPPGLCSFLVHALDQEGQCDSRQFVNPLDASFDQIEFHCAIAPLNSKYRAAHVRGRRSGGGRCRRFGRSASCGRFPAGAKPSRGCHRPAWDCHDPVVCSPIHRTGRS